MTASPRTSLFGVTVVTEDDTDSLKATLAVITTYANKAKEVT